MAALAPHINAIAMPVRTHCFVFVIASLQTLRSAYLLSGSWAGCLNLVIGSRCAKHGFPCSTHMPSPSFMSLPAACRHCLLPRFLSASPSRRTQNTNMLVVLRCASLTVNRLQRKCGFVLKPHSHKSRAKRAIKKTRRTARVFCYEVPYRFAFAQSPDNFHLPPTISTMTRAR